MIDDMNAHGPFPDSLFNTGQYPIATSITHPIATRTRSIVLRWRYTMGISGMEVGENAYVS